MLAIESIILDWLGFPLTTYLFQGYPIWPYPNLPVKFSPPYPSLITFLIHLK